jgi:ribosome maturation factor RimP
VRTEDDLRQLLHELVEPVAAGEGVDLVDVAVRGTGGRQLVKVIVDRKGGVDLATCQRISQTLSARLDEADPIPGRYALEVTSPGIDHPLEGRAAFDRVEGREVLVHRGDDERVTQVRGTVLAAEDDGVLLDTGGEQLRIAYAEIVKATQTLPW